MHCKTAKAVPCPARSAARPASTQGQKKPTKQSEQFSQHPQNSCFHLLSINSLLESFILFFNNLFYLLRHFFVLNISN